MTDEEFAEKLDRYLAVRAAQQQPKRGRKKKQAVIEPDYDSMDLATFGDHLQSTSQDCMELGITSGFNAARAFERGRYIEGTVETCKAVVGVASVVAIFAELLGAASGRD